MRRHFWKITAAVIVLALIFGGTLVRMYTDWLWFKDLGFVSIFGRLLVTRLGLFLATTVFFFAVVYLNLRIARRIAPIPTERLLYTEELRERIGVYAQRVLGLVLSLGALVVAVLVGLGSTGNWNEALRFIYSVPFGVSDPIFHRDLGFYVFQLPFLRYIYSQVFFALFISLAAVVAFYYLGQAIEFLANIPRFAPRVKAHIFTLLALLFALKAWGYWLDRYSLMVLDTDLIPGPGYSEVYGRLPALSIMMVATLAAAVVTLLNIRQRGIYLALGALLGLIGVSILVGAIYPAALQRFVVKPNELDKQQRFISYGIEFTRKGYGLDNVLRPPQYNVRKTLTSRGVAANQATIQNVRLWDYRPLLRTYKQLQELQQYYEFKDVDIDRYMIDGQYRQVMLSARELQQEGLSAQAKTWVNAHLVYTHGYGLVMSPVNEVSEEGLPELFISDMPPVSSVDIDVRVPALYFGELTDNYALVRSGANEFDYPAGDKNVFARYKEDRGVPIGNAFIRSMFATRFADMNLLITPNINPRTRLLFRRTVEERVTTLFPFLQFDNDPYLVLSEGRMYWIQDAYTTSDRLPYSQLVRMPFNYAGYDSRFNYIRNSVKITIDAYTGDVRAYVYKRDPIIRVYDRAFRGVFRPVSEMPKDLRRHVRYPEDLFSIQTEVYNTYHMTDPQVFYNKGDLWETAQWQEATSVGAGESTREMEPYYMIMRLPGASEEEFILLKPFTRAGRTNMVAWICAKCDQPGYGKLVVFEFEKGQLVFGPAQIEARANQDAAISQQLTLWGQLGSKVIWGNLLAIPIENALLYVQPLYLESTATNIPEFRRVIVALGDRLVMEEDLRTAISRVIGAPVPEAPPPTAGPAPGARPAPPAPMAEDTRTLVDRASEQFRRAQEAQRKGDWAAYGEELRRLEQTLNQLQKQAGGR